MKLVAYVYHDYKSDDPNDNYLEQASQGIIRQVFDDISCFS